MLRFESAAARRRKVIRRRRAVAAGALLLVAAACAGAVLALTAPDHPTIRPSALAAHAGRATAKPHDPDPAPDTNIYSHTLAGMLTPVTRRARYLVYVPDSQGDGVYVINPRTYKVIDYFPTGAVVQHVVPAWDLKTLYAT
ncbi:MAG TPA: hypothetical protein VGI50_11080, partial [Solirubrobacteraceae bacterium]